MSLIQKILAAFAAVVALSVVIGVIGLQTVETIDREMKKTLDYELASENYLASMETLLQKMVVPQRTLLNSTITGSGRMEQHEAIKKLNVELKGLVEETDKLFNSGLGIVPGWDRINAQWKEVMATLKKWSDSIDEGCAKLYTWEATTIMNPDALLRDTMRYRGDHFQLVARLGEMLALEKSIGPEIDPADDLCGFGQWRGRFDSGEEVFSQNPALKRAMEIMTVPHREFHRTAAETQQLLGNYGRNQERAAAVFIRNLEAARQVVDTFGLIAEEAEKARDLYVEAENFILAEQKQLGDAAMVALDGIIKANKETVNSNITRTVEEGTASGKRMRLLVVLTVVFALGMMGYMYLVISRRLVGPLTQVITVLESGSHKLLSEAQNVADLSTALSEGAGHQSVSLEETAAAIDEITSMVQKNLENSRVADSLMHENAEQIKESDAAMLRMNTAMIEIKGSSEKIGNILKTIEGIAFQTNLLALNAAVEAARAGEAGQGFAVVADEVRNLAQRSAQAVKDTAELIEVTVDRVNNGVLITGHLEERFQSISQAAEKIAQMIADIDVATGEQMQGMEQVNRSMSKIDRVNQENAKHAESNASASVNLADHSNSLMMMIDDLGAMLGKSAADDSRKPAPGQALGAERKTPKAALPLGS